MVLPRRRRDGGFWCPTNTSHHSLHFQITPRRITPPPNHPKPTATPSQELFGASSADELARRPAPVILPPSDAPAARLLSDLLTRLRLERCAYMRLRVVRKGDALEPAFLNSLLEDRSPSGMSYVEFLCHIHRQIQNKMG